MYWVSKADRSCCLVPHLDTGSADLKSGDRHGGSSQKVDLLQQVKTLPVEKAARPLGLNIVTGGNKESSLQPQAHRRINPGSVGSNEMTVVGGGLRHLDGARNGRAVTVHGPGDFRDDRTQFPQPVDGFQHRFSSPAESRGTSKYSLGTPTRTPLDLPCQTSSVIRNRKVQRCGILGIIARCRIHDQGAVLHRPDNGASVILAPGQGRQAMPAETTVGGLEPHQTAQRSRNPDGTPGVTAHRQGALARGSSRPAASAGPAGNEGRVPGIVHVTVFPVFSRGTIGQRVHVQFSEEEGSRLFQLCSNRAVESGNKGIK